ncbi:MAG: sulfatase-like hydrolase/transferase, partial [Chloroflexota bacterium]|nr:sulfatase-like hydrolase/transferase [Chloroflexota bacterium]
MKKFNRRDFLKFASLFSTGLAFQRFTAAPAWSQQNAGEKNIIIVVLDALSACNIALHGYARDTMPNLAKLAEKAVVYHNHYAAGNFTTPGTASLLTGTLPWSHRA